MYERFLPWHVERNSCQVCIKEVEIKEFKEKKFTLLNWNVYKNNHSFKWLHDFAQILYVYKPHLITFQEYKTKSKRSILDQHKKYGYGFFPNMKMREDDNGLINASTCEISEFNSIFSEHLEPFIKTPKISFFTQYLLPNSKKLTLINTHLINFVQNRKYLSQINQIEKLCQNQEMLILCGDFNTWSAKRMHILKNMTNSLGLNHVEFEVDHHKKSYLTHPLDHVFYKGLKPTKTEILKNIKTSDHKPIIVEFSMDI